MNDSPPAAGRRRDLRVRTRGVRIGAGAVRTAGRCPESPPSAASPPRTDRAPIEVERKLLEAEHVAGVQPFGNHCVDVRLAERDQRAAQPVFVLRIRRVPREQILRDDARLGSAPGGEVRLGKAGLRVRRFLLAARHRR